MQVVAAGDLAQLIGDNKKHFIFVVKAGAELQTHRGVIRHDDLIGLPWGAQVESHLGHRYYLLEPTLNSVLLHIRRRSQIIFPKDIGYILLRLSAGPGQKILEAGTGSGALTTALAWAVGPEGTVISYDRRQDMQELALANLKRVGLQDRVSLRLRDIEEGFDEIGADAIFLDLPNPDAYLAQVRQGLKNGGVFGAILPSANQVSALLEGLEEHGLVLPDVCEIMMRFYKPVPARLRPTDRMVAHTGYLVFARSVLADPSQPALD